MKIAQTIAIIAASGFLTVAAAQAATDGQPTNMNGQPITANQSDMHPIKGRSAMMMHHHHHHHHYHHAMMHHHMMKPMMEKKPM